jgi:hypothetical protein
LSTDPPLCFRTKKHKNYIKVNKKVYICRMKTQLMPVIHMVNQNQVLTNVRTCIDCGIEKVWIINHVVTINDLIDCAKRVKREYPSLWVGVNMLGNSPKESLRMDTGFDGLWCDGVVPSEYKRNFKGLFFGGVAFKYQPQPKDLREACEWAKLTTDVATTSGTATGKPADINKIRLIREYLGDHPMAIASGVSVENINDYKGVVDYLLVASSITTTGEIIIKDKLVELKNKI